MVLHSIVPIDTLLMQISLGENSLAVPGSSRLFPLPSGGKVQGKVKDGQFTVERLISTDPRDFLNAKLSPGVCFSLPYYHDVSIN